MDGGEPARKAFEALDLHLQGYTLQEIADQVGYKYRSGAQSAVRRALKCREAEFAAEAENGRTKAHARYLVLFRKAAELALAGNMKAMTHAVRLADRLASIEGVKPPEETLRVQMVSEVDEQIMRLSEALNARAQGPVPVDAARK